MTVNKNPGEILKTKQQKLSFLQNLILVIMADNYVDQAESDFLLRMGNDLGLTAADVKPITDNIANLSFITPSDEDIRLFELQTMVMLMMADGSIDDREYNLCLSFAERMDLNKIVLDDFIYKLSS